MKKGLTEIVFILDRSGSMSGLEADTIGGYNSMLEKQKKEDGDAVMSTVLFDDTMEVLHDRKDLKDVEKITDQQYYVRGCTALLDAVGGSIHHIGKVQKALPEEEKPEKTLFIITTDGRENASCKYTYEKVKKMVEKKKEKKGWEFIFLGANIDAIDVAGRFGVAANRAVRYENDAMGAELNYGVISKMVSTARSSKSAKAMSDAFETGSALEEVRADYEEFEKYSKMRSIRPDYRRVSPAEMEAVLPELTPRVRDIVKMLYGLQGEKEHTYEEVGRIMGMTATRVRQYEGKAIRVAKEKRNGGKASRRLKEYVKDTDSDQT